MIFYVIFAPRYQFGEQGLTWWPVINFYSSAAWAVAFAAANYVAVRPCHHKEGHTFDWYDSLEVYTALRCRATERAVKLWSFKVHLKEILEFIFKKNKLLYGNAVFLQRPPCGLLGIKHFKCCTIQSVKVLWGRSVPSFSAFSSLQWTKAIPANQLPRLFCSPMLSISLYPHIISLNDLFAHLLWANQSLAPLLFKLTVNLSQSPPLPVHPREVAFIYLPTSFAAPPPTSKLFRIPPVPFFLSHLGISSMVPSPISTSSWLA